MPAWTSFAMVMSRLLPVQSSEIFLPLQFVKETEDSKPSYFFNLAHSNTFHNASLYAQCFISVNKYHPDFAPLELLHSSYAEIILARTLEDWETAKNSRQYKRIILPLSFAGWGLQILLLGSNWDERWSAEEQQLHKCRVWDTRYWMSCHPEKMICPPTWLFLPLPSNPSNVQYVENLDSFVNIELCRAMEQEHHISTFLRMVPIEHLNHSTQCKAILVQVELPVSFLYSFIPFSLFCPVCGIHLPAFRPL